MTVWFPMLAIVLTRVLNKLSAKQNVHIYIYMYVDAYYALAVM